MTTSLTAESEGRAHVILAPDKFKGSLTAAAVADALAAGIATAAPGTRITRVPVADGGDGTVEAALAAGFTPVTATVTGPLGQPVRASFALGDGQALGAPGTLTAVIELATASGLDVLPQTASGSRRRDALHASSRGTGKLVRAALDAGARLPGLPAESGTPHSPSCTRSWPPGSTWSSTSSVSTTCCPPPTSW